MAGPGKDGLRPRTRHNSWAHFSVTFWGLGFGIMLESARVRACSELLLGELCHALFVGDRGGRVGGRGRGSGT